jgi:hypothetical protein
MRVYNFTNSEYNKIMEGKTKGECRMKKIKFSVVYETKTAEEFSNLLGEEIAKLIIKNNIPLETITRVKTII